ncbi:MAG: hypothetical protein JSV91_15165 [Phycisphaerales bacterium]|nr:MAG: hypothetical protein JSV91_15165 [Phycisphaerales bacterium]
MTTWKVPAGVACTLAIAPLAAAQVVVGVDNPDVPVYLVDVNTGVATELFTPSDYGTDGIWGLAADDINGYLYYSGGTELYRVPYDTLEPEFVADFASNDAIMTIAGLGFNPQTGLLYGSRTAGDEGIYEINPTDGHATLLYEVTGSAFDLGGFDYDVTTDAFYGLNDDITPFGRGLFEIDPFSQNAAHIVDYPGGQTDVDGLAVGDGRAYFVTDDPGEIFIYNLLSSEWETSIASPWFSSELFSGATWAPGLVPSPSSLALLAMAGFMINRRHHRLAGRRA